MKHVLPPQRLHGETMGEFAERLHMDAATWKGAKMPGLTFRITDVYGATHGIGTAPAELADCIGKTPVLIRCDHPNPEYADRGIFLQLHITATEDTEDTHA